MLPQISQFFAAAGVQPSPWEQKPNGQQLLRCPGVVVSVYKTGTVLWQGKRKDEYKNMFAAYMANPRPKDENNKTHSTEQVKQVKQVKQANPADSIKQTKPVTTFKGQKSTLAECNAFLRQVEGKTGVSDGWWESKPNTQLFVRLSHVGKGNLSFYTGKQTLLIQGKDAVHIRRHFIEFRAERMKQIEEDEQKIRAEEQEQERLREESSSLHDAKRRKCSTDSVSCKHCGRPMATHTHLDGQVVCHFSGKFRCSCGRWWWSMALKIQNLDPSPESIAFPKEFFPDCRTCEENFDVELLHQEPPGPSNREIITTNRGHQFDLCTLCKAGVFCPRA